MSSEGFSATVNHQEKVINFAFRNNIPSREVVERTIGYLRDNREYAKYSRIFDFRFWDGYMEIADLEWLSVNYRDLFSGSPPPVKVAVVTFSALDKARSKSTAPLFEGDEIAVFETTIEARNWANQSA